MNSTAKKLATLALAAVFSHGGSLAVGQVFGPQGNLYGPSGSPGVVVSNQAWTGMPNFNIQPADVTPGQPRIGGGDPWADAPTGPSVILYGRYDFLVLGLTESDGVPVGDPAQEGTGFIVDGNPGGTPVEIRNTFFTDIANSEAATGHRYEFGYMQGNRRGFVSIIDTYNHVERFVEAPDPTSADALVLFNDPNGLLLGYVDFELDGLDDDFDGDGVFGRDGIDTTGNGIPDTPAPEDFDDRVPWLANFASANMRTNTRLRGVELMWGQEHPLDGQNTGYELLYGVRYLDVADYFGVVGSGGNFDGTTVNTSTHNNIFGPQIGARVFRHWDLFSLTAEARFTPGINFQRANLRGSVAPNFQPNNNGRNEPIGLTPAGSVVSDDSTEFSPIGELRVESAFHPVNWMQVRLGYNFFATGGIGRAAPRVQYTLPGLGLNENSTSEEFFGHAFMFGVDIFFEPH